MKQARKVSFRTSAAVMAMSAMALLSGCKGFFTAVNNNPTGTGTSSFVYVTNVSSTGSGGTLTAYSLTSGVLAALSGSPITLPADADIDSGCAEQRFLVCGNTTGCICVHHQLRWNPDRGQQQHDCVPRAVAADQHGGGFDQFVADHCEQRSTELDALPLDTTTGIPTTPTPASITLSATTPVQLAMAPANNNIFVAHGRRRHRCTQLYADQRQQSSGKAGRASTRKVGSAANTVAVDTTSAYLFIGESNATSSLRLIAITNLAMDVADYAVGNGPVSILPEASGSYVYVANSTDGTISGFAFSAGALSALTGSPFATEKLPVGLVEDSSKTYLMDAGFGANPNLWMYSLDATSLGALDVKTTTSTGPSVRRWRTQLPRRTKAGSRETDSQCGLERLSVSFVACFRFFAVLCS